MHTYGRMYVRKDIHTCMPACTPQTDIPHTHIVTHMLDIHITIQMSLRTHTLQTQTFRHADTHACIDRYKIDG